MAFGSQSFSQQLLGENKWNRCPCTDFYNWTSAQAWQNIKFVFNPRWDMHSLRAKEIKDSPNSQAVPKILVHKKWHCLVPHWLRFLLFLQYSLAWLVSPSWLYQMLWDSPKFRTKENQRQPDFTSSPNTLIHWYHCDSDLYICLCPFPEG